MDYDDIIYLTILISSILLGYFFQLIQNAEQKRQFSTALGFCICLVVSGHHILHPICLTLVIGFVIQRSNVYRHCHVICFFIGFMYLSLLRAAEHLDLFHPTGHTNIIQMMLTLKLIGLAFEVHDNDVIKMKLKNQMEVSEYEKYKLFSKPRLQHVFHYAFCYAGILTGPYFTYRTYSDMFQYPYHKYKFCAKRTLGTLSYVPVFAILFLLASNAFPLKQLTTNEFHTDTSFFFRLWYMYPTFFIFRMRMYIAFKLSEAVCMMAGLGMYPAATKPKLGSGPSASFGVLQNTSQSMVEEYSFETVHTINILDAESSYTVREATRHWNRTIQYWLATYVYRRFPYKKYRTLATFFISSLWHGMHAGYYFSLFSVPLYLFVEDLVQKRMLGKKIHLKEKFLLWNVKTFQFSYWGLAFQVKDYLHIWRYGVSIWFAPYIVALGMLVISLCV